MLSNCPNLDAKLIAGQKRDSTMKMKTPGLISKLLYDLFMKNICCRSLFSKYLWFMLNRNPTAFRRHVAINVPFFLFLCFSLPVRLCLFRDEFIYLLFYFHFIYFFWQISSTFLLLLSYLVAFYVIISNFALLIFFV